MEFPFGHHHRPEDDPNQDSYGQQPPPPPTEPFYGGGDDYPPPPPAVHHVSHEFHPPPSHHEFAYGRPDYPPPPSVHHGGHEAGYGGGGHGFDDAGLRPQPHHHGHDRPGGGGGLGELLRQPTVRVFTKAAEDYSLSVREGKVVLVRADPRDEYQHWIKDMKYSTSVKDAEGCPSFALVNKATGEAIKHAIGAHHPVRLVPYNPDYLDESVLWAESKDTGEGFRCIRMVNNIELNFDAFNGDEDHGGVHDGTEVVLWEWLKGKNQRWMIVPY